MPAERVDWRIVDGEDSDRRVGGVETTDSESWAMAAIFARPPRPGHPSRRTLDASADDLVVATYDARHDQCPPQCRDRHRRRCCPRLDHLHPGGDGGEELGGLPTFAWLVIIAFGVNIAVFAPSFLAKTEHYYDLPGR